MSNVEHPPHYTQGSIECIDVIEDWNLGYHEGNALKYLCRYKYKNGIEDLKKVSSDISENLQTKIDTAAIITDDLAFLSEKAAEITNIMEKKVQPYKQTIVNSNTNHTINAISPEKVRELKQKKLHSIKWKPNFRLIAHPIHKEQKL